MTEAPRILALFGGGVPFGQERGNVEALAALKARGCDILCLVRNEEFFTAIPEMLDSRGLTWRKIPYVQQPWSGCAWWLPLRNAAALLIANWQFLKIVRFYRPTHIHAFNELFVFNFLIGLAFTRIPMIYRAGDEPTIHNRLWRLVWRFVVRRANRFVANSEYVARSLCSSGVQRNSVVVIYNAPPERLGARKPIQLDLPLNARPIVFIGQVIERKGVQVLVDAFRELAPIYPDTHLLIAGRVSEWVGDTWGRTLKQCVVADSTICERVTFLDYVDDVPTLLERGQIHVVPSLFDDPSPNVVMEAKRAARPSVVFPRGGLPELIKHGIDGFVCREASASALVEGLAVYLDDPALGVRHGRAAYESLRMLGVPDFSRRWFEVYTSAAQPRPSETAGNKQRTLREFGR